MIHAVCGSQNNGKTLVMTYLGLKDFQEGRTIISNYNLSFKHYLINKDFLFWLGKEQPAFNNVTFLLDELWIWVFPPVV